MYNDVNVIIADLPDKIKACTVPNCDPDSYTVIVNARLSYSGRQRAIKHELQHINKDDCYNDTEIAETLENKIID